MRAGALLHLRAGCTRVQLQGHLHVLACCQELKKVVQLEDEADLTPDFPQFDGVARVQVVTEDDQFSRLDGPQTTDQG